MVDVKTTVNDALDWWRITLDNKTEQGLADDLAVSDTTIWRIRQLMIGKTCLAVLKIVVAYLTRPTDTPTEAQP
jgi:hypothetical protein